MGKPSIWIPRPAAHPWPTDPPRVALRRPKPWPISGGSDPPSPVYDPSLLKIKNKVSQKSTCTSPCPDSIWPHPLGGGDHPIRLGLHMVFREDGEIAKNSLAFWRYTSCKFIFGGSLLESHAFLSFHKCHMANGNTNFQHMRC